MAVTDYCVIDGEVVSEVRNGVERDYVPDPQGNTVALLDSTQTKTDTYIYWPFGEIRSSTGSSVTPFKFGGTLGYYRDSTTRTYVRARELQQVNGRWMTVDPFWPAEPAYGYASNQPTTSVDTSGYQSSLGIRVMLKQAAPPIYDRNDRDHNCYTAACDVDFSFRPGWQSYVSGQGPAPNPDMLTSNCSYLVAMAKRDGALINLPSNGRCPVGYYKVKVYISQYPDYHFIRQDANGSWSDKHGERPVQPECVGIIDPDYHAAHPTRHNFYPTGWPAPHDPFWTPIYTTKCGTYCAKRRPKW